METKINKIITTCANVGCIQRAEITNKNNCNVYRMTALTIVIVKFPKITDEQFKEFFGIKKGRAYSMSLELSKLKREDASIRDIYMKCCQQ